MLLVSLYYVFVHGKLTNIENELCLGCNRYRILCKKGIKINLSLLPYFSFSLHQSSRGKQEFHLVLLNICAVIYTVKFRLKTFGFETT